MARKRQCGAPHSSMQQSDYVRAYWCEGGLVQVTNDNVTSGIRCQRLLQRVRTVSQRALLALALLRSSMLSDAGCLR